MQNKNDDEWRSSSSDYDVAARQADRQQCWWRRFLLHNLSSYSDRTPPIHTVYMLTNLLFSSNRSAFYAAINESKRYLHVVLVVAIIIVIQKMLMMVMFLWWKRYCGKLKKFSARRTMHRISVRRAFAWYTVCISPPSSFLYKIESRTNVKVNSHNTSTRYHLVSSNLCLAFRLVENFMSTYCVPCCYFLEDRISNMDDYKMAHKRQKNYKTRSSTSRVR